MRPIAAVWAAGAKFGPDTQGTAEVGVVGDLELDGVEPFMVQMWPVPAPP